MKYVEKVNEKVCGQLCSLSFTNFCKTYKKDSIELEETSDDMKTQYDILKKYCLAQINSNYKLPKTYEYAKGSSDGRLFVIFLKNMCHQGKQN